MVKANLAGDVHAAVGAVAAQLRLRYVGTQEPDVGFVALATLRHLVRHGPRSVTDLAHADRVTTQAISLRLRPLVDQGFAERTTDPRDGRKTVMSITDGGRALVHVAETDARSALALAIARLDTAERQALQAAIPALLNLNPPIGEAVGRVVTRECPCGTAGLDLSRV